MSREYEETIRQALQSDNLDQRCIASEGLKWVATLLKKNADYGSSVWKAPVLKPVLDPGDAILVRMSDKVSRIAELSDGMAPRVQESLADTVMDLGCYCLLWCARPGEGAT